jgi:hypothetical protein
MVWWGFVDSMIKWKPRYNDPEFIRFLRRWQRMSLIMGTKRATAKIDEEQQDVWQRKWGKETES